MLCHCSAEPSPPVCWMLVDLGLCINLQNIIFTFMKEPQIQQMHDHGSCQLNALFLCLSLTSEKLDQIPRRNASEMVKRKGHGDHREISHWNGTAEGQTSHVCVHVYTVVVRTPMSGFSIPELENLCLLTINFSFTLCSET